MHPTLPSPSSPSCSSSCDGIHSWIVARLCFQYINQMGQLISAYCMLSSHKILRATRSRSLPAFFLLIFFPFLLLLFRLGPLAVYWKLFAIVSTLFLSLSLYFSFSVVSVYYVMCIFHQLQTCKSSFFFSVSVSFFCCLGSLISLAFLLTREVCLMDL